MKNSINILSLAACIILAALTSSYGQTEKFETLSAFKNFSFDDKTSTPLDQQTSFCDYKINSPETKRANELTCFNIVGKPSNKSSDFNFSDEPRGYSGLIIGGGMMSAAGAVLVGGALGAMASTGDSYTVLLVPGGILLAGGIIMEVIGKKKRRDSVAIYKNINLQNLGFTETTHNNILPYASISITLTK